MTEETAPLHGLDVLLGRWRLTTSLAPADAQPEAETTFEWLEGERFLIQRWRVDHPDAPDGIAIIGYDDELGTCRQHYFDSRGIARVYTMSLADGVWRLERLEPGFSQRFAGTFDDSGTSIVGAWEISSDGTEWEHDFDLTYTRTQS
ncbi:MAG: hypothetical protein ACRDOX_05355 [Nocardioides sp.]